MELPIGAAGDGPGDAASAKEPVCRVSRCGSWPCDPYRYARTLADAQEQQRIKKLVDKARRL